jgi:hypothetical protein
VSGAVYGSYSWRIGRATRLQLNGRVAYVGTSSLALSGAAAPTMGGYATARASAVLDTGRWQVSLVLDNPAGTVGNTFAYGNPFSSRATQQTTPLRPATLTLSLATAF